MGVIYEPSDHICEDRPPEFGLAVNTIWQCHICLDYYIISIGPYIGKNSTSYLPMWKRCNKNKAEAVIERNRIIKRNMVSLDVYPETGPE